MGLAFRLNGEPSDSTAWPLILHELMEALGPPRPLDSSIDFIEEADALDALGSPDRSASLAAVAASWPKMRSTAR